MLVVFVFFTPIIAAIFFANCISILKKVKAGKDVHNQTILGSLMFGFIVLSIVWSVLFSS
ncbi:hypothetical protein [Bacillus sinesaloumensis]|uniref:hypothetical protein n=1 Tax=Litchfieldia sinesaloumensis TaxID=1926280 RepID=UPI0009884F74|nr:hypothetical protein [Bacillus sinesaloumensis]